MTYLFLRLATLTALQCAILATLATWKGLS